jgi:hypothetical protein
MKINRTNSGKVEVVFRVIGGTASKMLDPATAEILGRQMIDEAEKARELAPVFDSDDAQ